MLALPTLMPTSGVKVAVRVRPLPVMALKVPPVTTTSPVVPSQAKLAPGSSLKVKVMVAVSPACNVAALLLMCRVGGVVSLLPCCSSAAPAAMAPRAKGAEKALVCGAT